MDTYPTIFPRTYADRKLNGNVEETQVISVSVHYDLVTLEIYEFWYLSSCAACAKLAHVPVTPVTVAFSLHNFLAYIKKREPYRHPQDTDNPSV